MPFAGNMNRYRQDKTKQDFLSKRLTVDELNNFTVPVKEFLDNVKCLRKTKPFVKTCILKAVGVDMNAKDVNIDFETFLQITKMLTPKC